MLLAVSVDRGYNREREIYYEEWLTKLLGLGSMSEGRGGWNPGYQMKLQSSPWTEFLPLQ